MEEIKIDQIRPNPNQPRKYFDEASLVELAESIKVNGLLNPILVRNMSRDIFEIVHGERRWRACQLAGLETIRAEIRDLTDQEAFTLSLVENIQRGDLTPLEEADAYKVMLDEGITQEELGEQIGKSQSYIAQKLRLLKLPPGTAYCLRVGAITEGHARQLLRLKKMYPKSVPARKKGGEPSGDPIEMVNYHLENMQPEGKPQIELTVRKKQISDPKFIIAHNAIVELLEKSKKKIPQWWVTSCWWAVMSVLGSISVADLGTHLTAWRNRYGSALVWWLCFGEQWLEGWVEVKDKSEKEFEKWAKKYYPTRNAYGFGFYHDLICSNSHEGVEAPEDDILKCINRHNYLLPSHMQNDGVVQTSMFCMTMADRVKEKTGIDYWHVRNPVYGELKRKEAAGEEITPEERIEAVAELAGKVGMGEKKYE